MIHEFEELVPVETPLGSGYAMLYEGGVLAEMSHSENQNRPVLKGGELT